MREARLAKGLHLSAVALFSPVFPYLFTWLLHYGRLRTNRVNTTRKSTRLWPTRMWANAQRDGRPAEYRWRPLFNAAKFGWRPLLECRAVTLPRRETRSNLQRCPKLAIRSQLLVGQSSPYYENMWARCRCLTSFFPIVDTCLSCEDTVRESSAMVPNWRFFASCIFSEQRTAHFWHAFSILLLPLYGEIKITNSH